MCSNIEDVELRDPLDITQLEPPTEVGPGNPQSVISIVEIKEDFGDEVDVGPIVLQKTQPASLNGAVTEMCIMPAGTSPSTTTATDRSRKRQAQATKFSHERQAQATKFNHKQQPHDNRSQLQVTATTGDTTGTPTVIGNSDALDTQNETSTDNIHEGDVFIAKNLTTMGQATRNLKRKAKVNETIINVKIIVDESTQTALSSEHESIIISTNIQPDDNNCKTEEVTLFCESNTEYVDEIAQHEVVSKKHDTKPSRYYVINDDGEIAQVNSNVDQNSRNPSLRKKVVVRKYQSIEIVLCKCELECHNKFTQPERETIFNEFRKLKVKEQNNLIRCLVTKRKRQVSNRKRQVSDQKRQVSDQIRQVLDQNRQVSDQKLQVSDQKRQVSDKKLTPNSVTGSCYTYQLPSPNGDQHEATTSLIRKVTVNKTVINVKVIAKQPTEAEPSSEDENIVSDTDNCKHLQVSLLCEKTMMDLDSIDGAVQHEVSKKYDDTEPSMYFKNDDEQIAQAHSNVKQNNNQQIIKEVLVRKHQSTEIVLDEAEQRNRVRNMCTCDLPCYDKFTRQQRLEIFIEYAKLKMKEQNILLRCLVTQRSAIMRNPDGSTSSLYRYHLPSPNGDKHEVCKALFLTTLGYTDESQLLPIFKKGVSKERKKKPLTTGPIQTL